MTDEEFLNHVRSIKDPAELLREFVAWVEYAGVDGYYKDITSPFIEHIESVVGKKPEDP